MLIAKLFGFEEQILENHCETAERSRYQLISFWFLSIVFLFFVSNCMFFYLLSSEYLVTVIGASISTFMFYSIIRFIHISVAFPKEDIGFKATIVKKSNLIRMLFFSFIVLMNAVPLVEELYRNQVEEKLESYKSESKVAYKSKLQAITNKKLASIRNDLKQTKKSLKRAYLEYQQKSLNQIERGEKLFVYKRIQNRYKQLQAKHLRLKSKFDKETNLKFQDYEYKLATSTLPIERYVLLFTIKDAKLFLLISVAFFSSLFPFYLYAISKVEYNYARTKNKLVNTQILDAYALNQAECKNYLKNKYNYDQKSASIYEDEPFNTTLKAPKTSKLEGVDLFTHLNENHSI